MRIAAVSSSRRAKAFSLVEILIVVVILGILAAIAVPKFANASSISRENSLKEDLRLMRTQLGVYKTQHLDVDPGFPAGDTTQTPTAAIATSQLTSYTDNAGNISAVSSDVYKWGPYLAQIPVNPINALTTLTVLGPTDNFSADGTTGWLYQPSTGILKPNVAGQDSNGNNFSDY